jgi:luciferase family oxidoreductase group 1
MANPLVLSVLDQSPVSEGSTGADALRNTLDLARLADDLGYHRYWLAEHHGGTMLAGPSPEVLIGPVAMATSRIRVGSGGVMLPHYSPLKVAESFSILAGLFPDRIDLAIGRAPGTDPMTTFALQRDRRQAAPDDFPTAGRAARAARGSPAARPSLQAPLRPARAPPRARALAAGLLAAERHLGGRARAAVRLRRLHQPHRRADRGELPQ